MNETGCPMWDAYNNCCMWERMERIFPVIWDCEMEVVKKCMEEMP